MVVDIESYYRLFYVFLSYSIFLLTFFQFIYKIMWVFPSFDPKVSKARGWIFEKASRRDWGWSRIANRDREGKLLEKAA